MAVRKPKVIQVGRCYRVYEVFSTMPSADIACVTEIKLMTKTSRSVTVEWLCPGRASDRFNYTEFLQRVHSEVKPQ